MGIPKLARSQLFRQACAQIWEKAMAPHSWKIPRTEEPGRLQSMGSQRVGLDLVTKGASVIAQLVKILPAMQETLVQFLGQEDPPEKEVVTHSSILA